jgi:polar amino acid transport system substrate-binding protein
MFRRALALALMVLPATTALADEPKLIEPGKITWGTSPTFLPYEFVKDSVTQGFDLDMMAELGTRVHLATQVMTMDFKGIIPGLTGKRLDVGVSGFYITPERLAAVDMVPYAYIGTQVVVKKGNEKHITGPTSLCGLHVGAAVGTVFEASAKAQSAACVTAGKPGIDILSVAGSNLVALAVSQGRVDAGVTSSPSIVAMMIETPDVFEPAGDPYDATTKLGIAVAKDNPGLRDALQTALDSMGKDGTYARLLAKWQLSPKTSIY